MGCKKSSENEVEMKEMKDRRTIAIAGSLVITISQSFWGAAHTYVSHIDVRIGECGLRKG